MSNKESIHTMIVGGGQAGLAAGYYLSRANKEFIILDENPLAGDTWRTRWDSLRLFTPSHMNNLPGMKFPKPNLYFPSKDETADYLEAYAREYNLPIRYGMKVDSLSRNGEGYHISAGEASFNAKNVIIATGAFHNPYVPLFASEVGQDVIQMHSSDYRNPKNITGQTVVVVGAGNSGAEIAIDLARAGKKVWLAGRDVGRIPISELGTILGGRPLKWFARHILTLKTPLGRKMKARVFDHGAPLGGTKREYVASAGVEFAPRVTGVKDGNLYLEDGRSLPADAIIWATGFHPDYKWIKLPIFNEKGVPRHTRGMVEETPGLYFLGLPFQTGLTSSLLNGVGEDAKYIVGKISA